MALAHAVKNKVKGQIEQTKGAVNQQRGNGAKGGMQKIKGNLQETLGDLELHEEKNRAATGTDDEL